jgi:hypothetical protein
MLVVVSDPPSSPQSDMPVKPPKLTVLLAVAIPERSWDHRPPPQTPSTSLSLRDTSPSGNFIEAVKNDSDFLAATSAAELEQCLATNKLPAN